ncbi:MAG: hypothetical protein JSR59_26255 [Proteobacteria bacterium]|nr:hypothetical protein [Pseudomonadota bacterium]
MASVQVRANVLIQASGGGVESSEGWAVHVLGPELIEYRSGEAACLVNVGYRDAGRAREIYASESASDLFPRLREHLQSALPMLHGHYVVV